MHNKLFLLFAVCLLWSCDKQYRPIQGQPIAQTPFFFLADTAHEGGLALLRNVAIIDSSGTILFSDSTTDYEPIHCITYRPDSAKNGYGYIFLRLFDPCDDSLRVLYTDGKNINVRGTVSAENIFQIK